MTFENRHAIFFDLDGTLVDNEHLKAQAFADAIKGFGGESQPSFYKEVMGMSGTVISKHFINEAGIEVDPDAYFQAYKSRYSELLKTDLKIRPGAIQLLNVAKEKRLHFALVSGASSIFVSYIVKDLALGDFFDFLITSDDVTHKKPHPECYLLALEKMSASRNQAIVFEDTDAGLEAASRAGIASISIRHAYNQSHDLSSAVAEYASFEDDLSNLYKVMNSIFDKTVF